MVKQSEVTIIIPHIDLGKETTYSLHHCLRSLIETTEAHIILSVNGSANRIFWPKVLVDNKDRFTIIHISDQGQCKGVNAAASIVDTPWLFITNNDMVYAPGWWDKLVGTLDTSLLCVSPKLVEPRPGAPTFEVYFCGGAGGDFDKMKWLEFASNYKGQGMRTGFNLPFLMSRELWDTVGGYDINYDPFGSNGDSDLEYKIKLAGVQPMQNTDCIVYHFSQTSGTFLPENDSYRFKNYAYFKEKWGFDRTDDGVWEATFEIPPENKFHPLWEVKYAI